MRRRLCWACGVVLAGAGLLLIAGPSRVAADGCNTWSGPDSGGNWSLGSNWSSGQAPALGSPQVLCFTPSGTLTTNDDISGLVVSSITVTTSASDELVITGQSLAFSASSAAITASATGGSGSESIPAGSVVLENPVVLQGATTVSGYAVFTGMVSGPGTISVPDQGQAVLGPYPWTPSGAANTFGSPGFVGVTVDTGGAAVVDNPGALGNGGVTVEQGGTLVMAGEESVSNPISLAGSGLPNGTELSAGVYTAHGALDCEDQATVDGPITLTGDATIFTYLGCSLNGAITGPYQLTIAAGCGCESVIDGVSTYSGGTILETAPGDSAASAGNQQNIDYVDGPGPLIRGWASPLGSGAVTVDASTALSTLSGAATVGDVGSAGAVGYVHPGTVGVASRPPRSAWAA
jgi:hypothetical protein